MIAQGEVDPAPLECRHGLELEHLARLDHARGGPLGEFAKLALATAPIVLDIDQDTGPGAHLLGEHQIDEVLERGQPLPLAPDERTERVAVVALGHDVEASRLARRDLDASVEAEVSHEGLEDPLTGGQRLGRGLGRFEIGTFRGDRAARGRNLGGLGCGQVSRWRAPRAVVAAGSSILTRAVVATWAAIGSPVGSDFLAGGAVLCRSIIGTRTAIHARTVVRAWASVVATGASIASVLAGGAAVASVIAARAAVASVASVASVATVRPACPGP